MAPPKAPARAARHAATAREALVPRRRVGRVAVVKVLVGLACYALACALAFVVMEHALHRRRGADRGGGALLVLAR